MRLVLALIVVMTACGNSEPLDASTMRVRMSPRDPIRFLSDEKVSLLRPDDSRVLGTPGMELGTQRGWWRYETPSGLHFRRVEGEVLDLRSPPTERLLVVAYFPHEMRAPVGPPLPTEFISRECSTTQLGCPPGVHSMRMCEAPRLTQTRAGYTLPCTRRVLVTTTPLSVDEHHTRAVALAQRARATTMAEGFAAFYVDTDGHLRNAVTDDMPRDCEHELHVVVSGPASRAQTDALAELLSVLVENTESIPATLPVVLRDEPECLTGPEHDGVVIPEDQVIDRAGLCREMLALGRGLHGCARYFDEPLELCGQRLAANTTKFECHDPMVSDIRLLSLLPTLAEVDLSGSGVNDLRPLMKSKVRVLSIEDTPVTDVWPVLHMLTIETLRVRGAFVKDEALEDLEGRVNTLVIKRR